MKNIIGKTILVICALTFLFPIILTILHSFTEQTVTEENFRLNRLFPYGFSLVGYYDLLIEHSPLLRNFWNSVFYAGAISCLNIIVSIPAAYGFSQAMFRGKETLFFFYIMLMMMPLQVTLLPNYIGLRDLKLLDTPLAIVLPAVFAPFSVFLMTQYMKGMEQSFVEAALLETKSVFRIMIQMIIPQLRTCIFAVFVFVFAEYWNMVEQSNIYLRKDSLKPLSGFLAIGEGLTTSEVLAGSVIFMTPIVILYLYFHDSLESGLESMKL